MKPKKKGVTVKAWIVIDTHSEHYYVDFVSLHRSFAQNRKRESIEHLQSEEKRYWGKALKVLPCTITYLKP